MKKVEYAMTSVTLKDLLCICLIVGIVMLMLIISMRVGIARLRQKNYFLNRDRERYAETLYALKDGYFAFIYPDERIKDPRQNVRERCSRRLAVMLNLKKGTKAGFEDVLAFFSPNDSNQLQKHLHLLQTDGLPFECRLNMKEASRSFMAFGARINGADGNLYCDIIFIREISVEMEKIDALEKEKGELFIKLSRFKNMLDNLPIPVWLRDERLNILEANSKYMSFVLKKNQKNPFSLGASADSILLETAQSARDLNKAQKNTLNLVEKGQARHFEVSEIAFQSESEKGTVGFLSDMTDLDETRRNFQIHQNAHLDVLSTLGTAFALFNPEKKLVFYNASFKKLWRLDVSFLDASPSYAEFLETLRNNRLLPEVSDFKAYKAGEEKLFQTLIEPLEQLLHLPDGRTLRRIVAAHPNGLIFAYEDVSDRLAATRTLNELTAALQNLLDQLDEAVLVFGADRRLRYFNQSYCKMWNLEPEEMQNPHTVSDVLDMQRVFFKRMSRWEDLKQKMAQHILSATRFLAERNDKTLLDVTPSLLSDQSLMVVYRLQQKDNKYG